MPRAKLRREPCDCLDCREPAAGSQPATASAAIARQQPPPKSLVVCLTGALTEPGASSLGEADVPHLDALVAAGWAGLLACRAGGPPLVQQLLGLAREGEAPPQSLPDRFKQLRAVLLTDLPATAHAGQLAGCYAVHQLGPSWQPPADLAARICSMLHVAPLPLAGSSEAAPALAAVLAAAGQSQPPAAAFGAAVGEEAEEGDEVIDMVLLALDAANAPVLSSDGEQAGSGALAPPGAGSSAALSSSLAALEWADDLVRLLNQEPGFRETVLLTLVVGPGQCAEQPLLVQDQPLLQPGQPQPYGSAAPAAAAGTAASAAALERATAVAAAPVCLPVQRPAQSYQLAGLDRVSVDAHSPAVVVHRLPAVIRQAVTGSRVPVSYFIEAAVLPLAAGCILAERLLPEVCYKLGRAPKYGA
ncbi:hypothetical protein COHA_000186 [Chlorella ohadii]|uniref:Uncharacterized protein n=1 Tax=Chlorella ohadii TaxID=2649997 RepID=A0AAD5H6P2_9CHLO|nr:hypothetical protein COHA_000186 [Chlorella ohadii]